MDITDVSWSAGRNMSEISYIDENSQKQSLATFTYDENGIRTSMTFLLNRVLKIKSPSKIRDIKKKARSLGIKGARNLSKYLEKQIFKVNLANITLSNIKLLLKKTINFGLKKLFGNSSFGRLII